MSIDAGYLIVAGVFLTIGFVVGYRLGTRFGRQRILERLMSGKDGELHVAAHYIIADEAEERRVRETTRRTIRATGKPL